jgi:hypothetical protein
MESDRREIGSSPQEGQVRIDVSVVVRGWCLATKSFDEGHEATVLSREGLCDQGFLLPWVLMWREGSWLRVAAWTSGFVSKPVQLLSCLNDQGGPVFQEVL